MTGLWLPTANHTYPAAKETAPAAMTRMGLLWLSFCVPVCWREGPLEDWGRSSGLGAGLVAARGSG